MEESVYLSIIIPCYNGEEFIETAICSVLSQKRNDVELIIVNDGSYDGTDAVCQKFVDCINVKYFYIENSGTGHARNLGMSKANGTWIAFLDADDLYIENSLDSVLSGLYEYDKLGYDVIYTSVMTGDMQRKKAYIKKAEPVDEIIHFPQYEFVSCLYRKEFLNRNNIRFFEYKEQDVETAFRYRVFSHSPRVVTDSELIFYFQRANPHSNTHTWKKDILHRVKSRVYLELLEQNVQKSADTWLLEVALTEVCRFYLQCTKNGCDDNTSIAYVNQTHNRLLKKSIGIPQSMRTFIRLCASLCFRILGNTIGRRKRK